jgi:hypothetical protein
MGPGHCKFVVAVLVAVIDDFGAAGKDMDGRDEPCRNGKKKPVVNTILSRMSRGLDMIISPGRVQPEMAGSGRYDGAHATRAAAPGTLKDGSDPGVGIRGNWCNM